MVEDKIYTQLWGGKPWREGAKLPEKQTEGAAAYDVFAWLPCSDDDSEVIARLPVELAPGERVIIKTGVNLRIPEGHCVDVKTRSGMSAKYGVIVLNGDGLIDEDYIGDGASYELGVILYNTDKNNSFIINHNDRIAQIELRLKIREKLGDDGDMNYDEIKTIRGTNRTGGFGSTGV